MKRMNQMNGTGEMNVLDERTLEQVSGGFIDIIPDKSSHKTTASVMEPILKVPLKIVPPTIFWK